MTTEEKSELLHEWIHALGSGRYVMPQGLPRTTLEVTPTVLLMRLGGFPCSAPGSDGFYGGLAACLGVPVGMLKCVDRRALGGLGRAAAYLKGMVEMRGVIDLDGGATLGFERLSGYFEEGLR